MANNKIIKINKAILKETIKKAIVKTLSEAAFPDFNPKELDNINTFKGRYNYCIQNLGQPQGKGSSRAVFQISDEKILKLAINQKGLAQNMEEGRSDWYNESLDIFPEVFEASERGTYIISEYVLPAKKYDFKKCIGITFEEYCTYIRRLEIWYKGKNYYSFHSAMPEEQARYLAENNEFLSAIQDYISGYPDVMIADLYVLQNYGLALRNGQPSIVILDSGYTEDIWKTYYKRY